MENRKIGKAGPLVSVVGLGCNNFGTRLDLNATRRVVHRALDLGVTFFDTADVYGFGASETFLGQALGARRKEVVLCTKFGLPMIAGALKGASRDYVLSALEASLRRLKTDWIDLYIVHKPDPITPIEQSLLALDYLVRQGKVRHIGCSSFSAAQINEAMMASQCAGLVDFSCSQDQYSLLVRSAEGDLLPESQKWGMSLLPYFPLATGMLTGKYKRDAPAPSGTRFSLPGYGDRFMTEDNWSIIEKLEVFCLGRGKELLDLAFAWLAANEAVPTIIAGAMTAAQVEANVRAASWKLTAEEKAEVDQLTYKPKLSP